MSNIPEFLKKENYKKEPYADEMAELSRRYEEHFGKDFSTEPAPYGAEQWVEILKKCLDENIEVEKLLPGETETPELVEYDTIYVIQ